MISSTRQRNKYMPSVSAYHRRNDDSNSSDDDDGASQIESHNPETPTHNQGRRRYGGNPPATPTSDESEDGWSETSSQTSESASASSESCSKNSELSFSSPALHGQGTNILKEMKDDAVSDKFDDNDSQSSLGIGSIVEKGENRFDYLDRIASVSHMSAHFDDNEHSTSSDAIAILRKDEYAKRKIPDYNYQIDDVEGNRSSPMQRSNPKLLNSNYGPKKPNRAPSVSPSKLFPMTLSSTFSFNADGEQDDKSTNQGTDEHNVLTLSAITSAITEETNRQKQKHEDRQRQRYSRVVGRERQPIEMPIVAPKVFTPGDAEKEDDWQISDDITVQTEDASRREKDGIPTLIRSNSYLSRFGDSISFLDPESNISNDIPKTISGHTPSTLNSSQFTRFNDSVSVLDDVSVLQQSNAYMFNDQPDPGQGDDEIQNTKQELQGIKSPGPSRRALRRSYSFDSRYESPGVGLKPKFLSDDEYGDVINSKKATLTKENSIRISTIKNHGLEGFVVQQQKARSASDPAAELLDKTKTSPKHTTKQLDKKTEDAFSPKKPQRPPEIKPDIPKEIDKNIGSFIIIPNNADTMPLTVGRRNFMMKQVSQPIMSSTRFHYDTNYPNPRKLPNFARDSFGSKLVLPQAEVFMEKQSSTRLLNQRMPSLKEIGSGKEDDTMIKPPCRKVSNISSDTLMKRDLSQICEDVKEYHPPHKPYRQKSLDVVTTFQDDDDDDAELPTKSKTTHSSADSEPELLKFYRRQHKLSNRTLFIVITLFGCTLLILGAVLGSLITILTYDGNKPAVVNDSNNQENSSLVGDQVDVSSTKTAAPPSSSLRGTYNTPETTPNYDYDPQAGTGDASRMDPDYEEYVPYSTISEIYNHTDILN